MRRFLKPILMVLCSVCLRAGGWTPIPAHVWALKEDAVAGGKGAVVVHERIRYGAKHIEYEYQARIFREAGKVCAQFDSLPIDATLLEGRTVYPDGREVLFNSAKDMMSVSLKDASGESKTKILEPPGLSADCVVELRYKINPFLWRTFWGEFRRWILKPVPSLEFQLELESMLPTATLMEFGKFKPEIKRETGVRTYTFRNLPARESAPFLQRTLLEEPMLAVYSDPEALREARRKGPSAFWETLGQEHIRRWYTDDVAKGWSWNGFAKEILAGLPEGDNQVKASEILLRLKERMANAGELTFQEQEKFGKAIREEKANSNSLSDAVKRGWATGRGMYLLAFQLFQDAGLRPRIVYVADRFDRLVQGSNCNIFQFNHLLLGIDVDRKPLLCLDPEDRTLPNGAVLGKFQGTLAMEVLSDSWSMVPVAVPEMKASQNLHHYSFKHSLSEGKWELRFDGDFQGLPERAERDNYFKLSPLAQEDFLKKSFEASHKDWVVKKTQVLDATSLRKPLRLSVTAEREYEDGRRIEISPFPGMPSALYIPDDLAPTRQVPISFTYAFTQKAEATITLPEGYKLIPVSGVDQENYFGRVRWEAKPDPASPSTVRVTFEVELAERTANEHAYATLLQFFGWLRDAQRRSVIVERIS